MATLLLVVTLYSGNFGTDGWYIGQRSSHTVSVTCTAKLDFVFVFQF
jgi:hypothetical protein